MAPGKRRRGAHRGLNGHGPVDGARFPDFIGHHLRQLVGGITVRIPVTLLTYYRDLGFDDAADSQLTIDLRLLKRGGLKLNL